MKIIFCLCFVLLSSCGAGNNNQVQPQNNFSHVITYKYVVVGESSTILSSTDGMVWESANILDTPESLPILRSIAQSRDFFVSVGDNNTILYSVDGLNWNSALLLTNQHLNLFQVVAINNQSFLAIAHSGGYAKIDCSYSGRFVYYCAAFSMKFLAEKNITFNGLAYDGSNIIAVGNDDLGRVISRYLEDKFIWSVDKKLGIIESAYSIFYDSDKYLINANKTNLLSDNYKFESIESYANNLDLRQEITFDNSYIGITNTKIIGISSDLVNWESFMQLQFVPNALSNNNNNMLFVGNSGRILLMNESMNVIFDQAVGSRNLFSGIIHK